MITFREFMQEATWIHKQNLNLYPLYSTEENLSADQIAALRESEAGIKSGSAALIQDCADGGIASDRLFLRCGSCTSEYLDRLWGRCRFVAETKDDLHHLDQMAARHLKAGHLEAIALSLLPESCEAERFSERNIAEFSKWIRFSKSLAVRGIFMDCRVDGNNCSLVKKRFSLIKQIRSDMPCLFSYFCLEGLLQPLSSGDENLLETLKMLSSLNDTSFYARFYIQ